MVIEKSNNSGLGAINISFFAGRNFQSGYTNGISNLTSQILYNGTENYEKKHIVHLPMQYGGLINSGVNDLFSTFNIRGLDKNIGDMVKLLFSMMFESKLGDLDKQKKIIRELNSNTMNDPFKVLLDRLNMNFIDDKFTSLRIGKEFDDININDVKKFYDEFYRNPFISIKSDDENVENLANSLLEQYNVDTNRQYISPFDYYSTKEDKVEFKWDTTTNNRILMYFVVDRDPVYNILTSVYQYKINKLLRLDKALCCRNRCICFPHGIQKQLFIIDIEFSDYNKKDDIINNVLEILDSQYTEREFEISKSQRLGAMLYDNCDPVKVCIGNCEELALGSIRNIEYIPYSYASSIKLTDYRYVMGVR